MTVLGRFDFDTWVIEVESMQGMWGPVLYCTRVDVAPAVPVAERGPTGLLRVTSWLADTVDPPLLDAALQLFLSGTGAGGPPAPT